MAGRRAYMEPIQRILRSKRLDPLSKHGALAYSLGAVWTEDRWQEAGYDSDGMCHLCGAPDSQYHRVCVCRHPKVQAARNESSPLWFRRMAQNKAEDLRFTRGLMPHPIK